MPSPRTHDAHPSTVDDNLTLARPTAWVRCGSKPHARSRPRSISMAFRLQRHNRPVLLYPARTPYKIPPLALNVQLFAFYGAA